MFLSLEWGHACASEGAEATDSPSPMAVGGEEEEEQAYASPEMLAGSPPSAASDVFSLGVLFFDLFYVVSGGLIADACNPWHGCSAWGNSKEQAGMLDAAYALALLTRALFGLQQQLRPARDSRVLTPPPPVSASCCRLAMQPPASCGAQGRARALRDLRLRILPASFLRDMVCVRSWWVGSIVVIVAGTGCACGFGL